MLRLICSLILCIYSIRAYRLKVTPMLDLRSIGPINKEPPFFQRFIALMDINSAETYLLDKNIFGYGYNSSWSKGYANLTETFDGETDPQISYKSSQFSGILAKDYFGLYLDSKKNFSKESFVLVTNRTGDFSQIYFNEQLRNAIVGVNPWIEGRTTMSKYYVQKNGIVQGFGVCKRYRQSASCYIESRVGTCAYNDKDKIYPQSITIPIKQHPKNYWQIEADSFTYDKIVSKRKYNVIFSTTTLDISLPKVLFDVIFRSFKVQITEEGYEIDCDLRKSAKDINLAFDSKIITIKGNIYADEIYDNNNKKCYLRIKPNKDNNFVLGVQFMYGYGICFNGPAKSVILNGNYGGELY